MQNSYYWRLSEETSSKTEVLFPLMNWESLGSETASR